MELRRRVDVARVGRRVLRHRRRGQRARRSAGTAARTGPPRGRPAARGPGATRRAAGRRSGPRRRRPSTRPGRAGPRTPRRPARAGGPPCRGRCGPRSRRCRATSTPSPTIAAWWLTASTPATARRATSGSRTSPQRTPRPSGGSGGGPAWAVGSSASSDPDVTPGAEQRLHDMAADEARHHPSRGPGPPCGGAGYMHPDRPPARTPGVTQIDVVLPVLDEVGALPWVLGRMPEGSAPSWPTTARPTARPTSAARSAPRS